jgi:hypothetical protein
MICRYCCIKINNIVQDGRNILPVQPIQNQCSCIPCHQKYDCCRDCKRIFSNSMTGRVKQSRDVNQTYQCDKCYHGEEKACITRTTDEYQQFKQWEDHYKQNNKCKQIHGLTEFDYPTAARMHDLYEFDKCPKCKGVVHKSILFEFRDVLKYKGTSSKFPIFKLPSPIMK